MKKLLILLTVLVITFTLAGCGNTDTPTNYIEAPPVEITLDTDIAELAEDVAVNSETLQDDELEQHLIQDLLSRPYLIPFQPPYPHMAQFFFTDASIPEDGYVFAEGEDGHISFEMILRYFINEDGRIDWEIVSFEVGNTTYPQLGSGIKDEAQADGWKTVTAEVLGFLVCIPAMWQSYEVDTGDPNSRLRIFGEGADGSIEMIIYASPLALSTLYYGLADTNYEPFLFDDGSAGYMVEYASVISWFHIEEGFGILGIDLWHDGNREIFTNNEDLILRIVKSVRNNSLAQ